MRMLQVIPWWIALILQPPFIVPERVLTQNIVIMVYTLALPILPNFRFCWLMILHMYMPILSFTPMLILQVLLVINRFYKP